MKLTSGLL